MNHENNKCRVALINPLGARSKILGTAKCSRLLPDFAMTPLECGLEETVVWYQSRGIDAVREEQMNT